MGQVLSNVVRYICGENEKDDQYWPDTDPSPTTAREMPFVNNTRRNGGISQILEASNSCLDSSPSSTLIGTPSKSICHRATLKTSPFHRNQTEFSRYSHNSNYSGALCQDNVLYRNVRDMSRPKVALQPNLSLESRKSPSIGMLLQTLTSLETFTVSHPSGSSSSYEELSISEEKYLEYSSSLSSSMSAMYEKEMTFQRCFLVSSPGFDSSTTEEEKEEERKANTFHPKTNFINPRDQIREETVYKGVVVSEEGRRRKQYSRAHKILLVGEGDFSFSASLAVTFGSAANMIATSLNSKDFLRINYGKVESNIQKLTSRGCTVAYGVDATKMVSHLMFKGLKFDRIVFNFPHAGT